VSNSKETVLQYLDTLNALEAEFPSTRFICMTGHAVYVDRWSGSELERNNRMLRNYAVTMTKCYSISATLISMTPPGSTIPMQPTAAHGVLPGAK